jgi:Flp pilus assembly protein TadD
LNARRNYTAAVEQCQEAVKLTPHDAQAHYDLAVNLQKAGNNAEARREFQTYLKLAPKASNAEAVRVILRKLEKS